VPELQAFLSIESDRPKGPMIRIMMLGVLVGFLELTSMALVIPAITLITGSSGLGLPLPDWAHQALQQSSRRESLLVVIGLLFASYSAKALVQVLYYRRHTALSARWQCDLAIRLLRGQLEAPYTLYLQRHSGSLIHNITVLVHETYGRFLNALFSLVVDSSSAFALIALSLIAAPIPTLAAGTMMGAIYVVQHYFFQTIHTRLGNESVDLLRREQFSLNQSLGAFREMRIGRREAHFLGQFDRLQDRIRRNTFQFEFTRRLPPVFGELTIILCVTVAVLILMARTPETGQIATSLGLLAAVAFRLSPLANRIVGSTGTIQNSAAGVEALAAELAENRAAAVSRPSTAEPLHITGDIELVDVSYRYPDREARALSNIDLTVRKGQVLGVVGGSGAGKTTLIDIVLGLLTPTEGHVLVDGTLVEPERYLSAGYVPQEIFLFDDTLRANIAFGAPKEEVDDDEIFRVLGLLRLDEMLARLPDGLDTRLGERGRHLSGGQRQRVGIARALCSRPELLILDEATSAMDAHTEERITDVISALRGGVTIIVIAHRLSTVRNCDSIVMLEEGRIVGQGSFDILYAQNAKFHSMVRSSGFVADVPSSESLEPDAAAR
jgi:ATP-binding cassette, subfamily B, bacterial PglK